MITYCTNIHPGEGWRDTLASLQRYLPPVKAAVSPHEPFAVGLRLSARAAGEIDCRAGRLFHEWLLANDLFVPTINGFPYGLFHGGSIKHNVYLPDWRSPDRAAYTKRLVDLLAAWLPDGVCGSVSTVPIGWRGFVGTDSYQLVRQHLVDVLRHMDRKRQERGIDLVLALEPEPGCVLETADDLAAFCAELALPKALAAGIALCLDCCHHAVAFEEPATVLGTIAAAGIRLGKVQVSSAPRWGASHAGDPGQFCEDRYLHQVVIRSSAGQVSKYDDLPLALERHRAREGDEWRVHYHVPLHAEPDSRHGTTIGFVHELLPLLPAETLLEVETYTWEVLPHSMRTATVAESIIREIQWLLALKTAMDRRGA